MKATTQKIIISRVGRIVMILSLLIIAWFCTTETMKQFTFMCEGKPREAIVLAEQRALQANQEVTDAKLELQAIAPSEADKLEMAMLKRENATRSFAEAERRFSPSQMIILLIAQSFMTTVCLVGFVMFAFFNPRRRTGEDELTQSS
jgi:hypothetical protein